MKTIVVRSSRFPPKLIVSAVSGFVITWLWGGMILHTDAQAGIAFLFYLPLCPATIAFIAAWTEHKFRRLAILTAAAAIGAAAAALTLSSGASALPCVATVALVSFLLALPAAALGYWVSRCFYRRVESDGCHCLQCGYLLAGLAADRCPECGGDIDFVALGRTRTELEALARESPDRSTKPRV